MWPKSLTDNVKVIIFDCDGVMFDSRKANSAFYNTILAHFEKPRLTDDALELVHMSTADESINYLFRDDPQLQEAQKYRKQVDYQQFIPFMTMEPFLDEVLEALKKKYPLAVATNRTNTIHPLLKAFKLEHFFDKVVSSLDVNHPKPHPEAIFKIVNHFGIDAREAVFVGDSPVDRETALHAKVFFVAYKNSLLHADHNIDNLREFTFSLICVT
jgi:haloacid dehalogenase superfamily, subfamily IA, variant 3 with third motif having DD or ED/haloacid dehalogenase superfamily, subfamily IA, variant 1 with third motif having Dx(3-4)D or Dx(3-4)E